MRSMCGADAGCLALNYQSLAERLMQPFALPPRGSRKPGTLLKTSSNAIAAPTLFRARKVRSRCTQSSFFTGQSRSESRLSPTHQNTSAPRRWTATLSSKVNLPEAINFRALCGANLVTYPPVFLGNETVEVHRVAQDKRRVHGRGIRFCHQAATAAHLHPSPHTPQPKHHTLRPAHHTPRPTYLSISFFLVHGSWCRVQESALEASHSQMDGFFSQLPYKCHLEEVASLGD